MNNISNLLENCQFLPGLFIILSQNNLFEVLSNSSTFLTLAQSNKLNEILEERKITFQEVYALAMVLLEINEQRAPQTPNFSYKGTIFLIAAELLRSKKDDTSISVQTLQQIFKNEFKTDVSRSVMNKRLSKIEEFWETNFLKRNYIKTVPISAFESIKAFPIGWTAKDLYNPQKPKEKIDPEKNKFLSRLLKKQGFIQVPAIYWYKQLKKPKDREISLCYLIYKPVFEIQTLEGKENLYLKLLGLVGKAEEENRRGVNFLMVDPTMIGETESLPLPNEKTVKNAENFVYTSMLGDGAIIPTGKTLRFQFNQGVNNINPNAKSNKLNYVVDVLNFIPKSLKTPTSFRIGQNTHQAWFASILFSDSHGSIFEDLYDQNYGFVEPLSSERYKELFKLLIGMKKILTDDVPQKLTSNFFEISQRTATKKEQKNKTLPNNFDLINFYFEPNVSEALAHLYMQDGHLTNGNWVTMSMYKDNFNDCCRLAFVIYILTKGEIKFLPVLEGKLDSDRNFNNKLLFDLALCAESHKKFAAMIKPYMSESVVYKIPTKLPSESRDFQTKAKAAKYYAAFAFFITEFGLLDNADPYFNYLYLYQTFLDTNLPKFETNNDSAEISKTAKCFQKDSVWSHKDLEKPVTVKANEVYFMRDLKKIFIKALEENNLIEEAKKLEKVPSRDFSSGITKVIYEKNKSAYGWSFYSLEPVVLEPKNVSLSESQILFYKANHKPEITKCLESGSVWSYKKLKKLVTVQPNEVCLVKDFKPIFVKALKENNLIEESKKFEKVPSNDFSKAIGKVIRKERNSAYGWSLSS